VSEVAAAFVPVAGIQVPMGDLPALHADRGPSKPAVEGHEFDT
jgi:hypothetical protein